MQADVLSSWRSVQADVVRKVHILALAARVDVLLKADVMTKYKKCSNWRIFFKVTFRIVIKNKYEITIEGYLLFWVWADTQRVTYVYNM